MKRIKLTKKELEKWIKKNQQEIDIMIFGNAFEDDKGNRIDPRNVIYDTEKNEYRITGEIFK